MKHKYRVGPRNSTVCGYPGRGYDWSKFCWDGSAVNVDDVDGMELRAPLPYADSFSSPPDYEYLHVPYDFAEQGAVYRVRANKSMWPGRDYRGLRVERQTVIKKEDGWYWVLEGEASR